MDVSNLSELELELLNFSNQVGLEPYAGTPVRNVDDQFSDEDATDPGQENGAQDAWRMMSMDWYVIIPVFPRLLLVLLSFVKVKRYNC